MSDTGNGSTGTVANAAGGGASGDDKDPYCEAFAEALHEWCGLDIPRGPFNDVYFRKLDGYRSMFPNSGIPDFSRESPFLVLTFSSRPFRVLNALALPAGVSSGLQGAAALLASVYSGGPGPGGYRALQEAMYSAFDAFKSNPANVVGRNVYGAWPDGLSRDGRLWLEVKGPTDTVSEFQEKTHKGFENEGGKVKIAGCKECPDAGCGGEDGNDCPPQYRSARR